MILTSKYQLNLVFLTFLFFFFLKQYTTCRVDVDTIAFDHAHLRAPTKQSINVLFRTAFSYLKGYEIC